MKNLLQFSETTEMINLGGNIKKSMPKLQEYAEAVENAVDEYTKDVNTVHEEEQPLSYFQLVMAIIRFHEILSNFTQDTDVRSVGHRIESQEEHNVLHLSVPKPQSDPE